MNFISEDFYFMMKKFYRNERNLTHRFWAMSKILHTSFDHRLATVQQLIWKVLTPPSYDKIEM